MWTGGFGSLNTFVVASNGYGTLISVGKEVGGAPYLWP